MKVKDVMHSTVTWVEPGTSIRQIANKMRDQDIGAIPVGEHDRLIGMITDRDICCRGLADGRDSGTLTARDVMSKPILYCRSDDNIADAVQLMEKKKVRRLPVIDKNKRMVGMLSLGDISHKVKRDLSAEIMKAVSAHHA
jgi:predicted transcriptional regulator